MGAEHIGDTAPGTLYLVATPIGNLGDMTLRGIETLRQVDLVASEDTRKTGRFLKHFGIEKRQVSFHEYNKERAGHYLLEELEKGRSVALVTNAGTPGIADPGYSLVHRALEQNIPVTMIPGPAAFVMAVVLSGLPVHSFTFRGFVPRRPLARRRFYKADAGSPYTLVYYESPHRLEASLRDALSIFGNRQAALANDLTKLYERIWRGTLSELLAHVAGKKPQGEYILVIEGACESRQHSPIER